MFSRATGPSVCGTSCWDGCGFADDRGLLHPELTASATAAEVANRSQLVSDSQTQLPPTDLPQDRCPAFTEHEQPHARAFGVGRGELERVEPQASGLQLCDVKSMWGVLSLISDHGALRTTPGWGPHLANARLVS